MNTSEKILLQRAKEYGSYWDNATFIYNWFLAIKITHNLLDVPSDTLAYLTKTMTGLKIARLKQAKSPSVIKDCVIDYFNYWWLNANELERMDKRFKMKVVFYYDTHTHLLGENRLVKQCVNLIVKEEWNSLNKDKIKSLYKEVLDLDSTKDSDLEIKQETKEVLKDEINLFNYQEKLNLK